MRLSDRLKRGGWRQSPEGGWFRHYAGCHLYFSTRCHTAIVDRSEYDDLGYTICVAIGDPSIPEGAASLAQRAKAAARRLGQKPKEAFHFKEPAPSRIGSLIGLPPFFPPMQQIRACPEEDAARFRFESLQKKAIADEEAR